MCGSGPTAAILGTLPAVDRRTCVGALPSGDPSALAHSALDMVRWQPFVRVRVGLRRPDYHTQTATGAPLSADSTPSSGVLTGTGSWLVVASARQTPFLYYKVDDMVVVPSFPQD